MGKKKKKSYYNMEYLNLVTHPSTYSVESVLTLLSELNMSLSLWYSDCAKCIFFIS